MSAPYPVRPEAVRPRGTAPFQEAVKALLPLACAGFLAACSAAPPPTPLAGADPADPSVRVPAASYRSPIGPYASQRPVEPKPWIEQNQTIAPQEKP
jgi:hypothetical protein